MRHRAQGRKLGRTSAHRKAMFRNQLTALFTHERITTTVPKAKELRPMAERMVTLARTGTLANRRRILEMVPDKEVVKRLFDDIAPRFADRPGGYTRIVRVGRRRGDNAEMAIIEFIDYEPSLKGEGGGPPKKSLMDRAKGMFGGRGDEGGTEPEAEEAEEVAAPEQPEAPEELEAAEAPEAAEEPEAEAETPDDSAVSEPEEATETAEEPERRTEAEAEPEPAADVEPKPEVEPGAEEDTPPKTES
jgi:large subunit ribosomal protein L17